MIAIEQPVAREVEDLCLSIRHESAREIFGNGEIVDRAQLAGLVSAAMPKMVGLHLLADDDCRPALLVAVIEIAPGRAGMIFLANDRYPSIAIAAHRWWRQVFVPGYLSQFRRVEFTGAADAKSARWMRSLGFDCEGIARRYAQDGEDFGYWAWIHPNWR